MFNGLTSTDLLVGVGRLLRMVAATEGGLEDFQRSQVLSAFSVTRLLASEQLAAPELLARTKEDLGNALAGDERPEVARARARAAAAPDGLVIGEAIGELLAALPREDSIRPGVNAALRDMADREVAGLARAPA